MSDEPSSSAAAASNAVDEPEQDVPLTATQLAEKRKKNRQMFNRKRGELLDDLTRNLDILIYAELSAVYYMDCSFLRFLMRGLVQFVMLTPKPSIFPEPPQNRPYVGAIFGTNILCLLLHIWLAAPSAGEATRGYLHGGLAMDFIGQKGPSSKLHLILLDLLIASLQVVHLAAHIVRQRLKDTSAPARAAGAAAATQAPTTGGQNLDAEERGLRRSDELQHQVERQGDIEMQTLNPTGSAPEPEMSAEDSSERDALLSTTLPRSDAHIFDAFHSGQIVLADLDLWKTVQDQFWAHWKAEPEPESSRHSRNVLRAQLLGRLSGFRFATGGRTV